MAPTTPRKKLLQSQSHSFCHSLTSGTHNPSDLVPHYLIPDPSPTKFTASVPDARRPRITEHGPWWSNAHLPFLAKMFVGADACADYFVRLGDTLQFVAHEHSFPPAEGFVVDEDAVVYGDGGQPVYEDDGSAGRGVVCVEGRAKFRSMKTGKEWDESFMYRLSGFDEAGRIGHWEIWADTLSAWEAVVGEVYEG
ncbi:MAG: hypothetical protein M1831_000440 [Alyxoria varia]|nr:MAG: hypothetical protein M1831_000440 [Alyxoria varia]